jgi:hypothetical protein
MRLNRFAPVVVVLLAHTALACSKPPAPLAQLQGLTRVYVQRDSEDFTFPITDSVRLTQLATVLRAIPEGWDGPIEPLSSAALTAVLWRGDTILGVVWVTPRRVAEQGRGVRAVFTKRITPQVETQLRALLDPAAAPGVAR